MSESAMRFALRMAKSQRSKTPDYDALIRSWRRQASLFRRAMARIGVEGKLIIGFVLLLLLGLTGSGWLYVSESRETLSNASADEAIELSQAIAMAAATPLDAHDVGELNRIGKDLVKNRNILIVVFFDSAGRPLSRASREASILSETDMLQANVARLMQAEHKKSHLLGNYSEVTAPVLESTRAQLARSGNLVERAPVIIRAPIASARLIGYVTIRLSETDENIQIRRVNILCAILGGFIFLLSLPVVSILVRRIFVPIRQLVDATNRIADGDLDTRVAIHRPDLIGTLARSFNEMVNTVKFQQDELAAANAELADANRDLETRIHQRTAQLETANTRLSSEIAEKEDFLRAISHDLNAPLRNISGMATVLLMKYRETFDQDIVHRLERIQRNVEVETDLISELLELSRIKTRRQKMEPVEITPLVNEVGDLFENDFRTRGINLIIDGHLPVLMCERSRMRQVFQNLIDNAIKYMGNGPIKEIHVGCCLGETEAEFYVNDTGIGIDPEDIGKVFYVFRRGRNNIAQNVAGKGVGLASVKSIIETYSGRVWVESTPDVGSTFRFTINGRYVPVLAQTQAGPRYENEDRSEESCLPVSVFIMCE